MWGASTALPPLPPLGGSAISRPMSWRFCSARLRRLLRWRLYPPFIATDEAANLDLDLAKVLQQPTGMAALVAALIPFTEAAEGDVTDITGVTGAPPARWADIMDAEDDVPVAKTSSGPVPAPLYRSARWTDIMEVLTCKGPSFLSTLTQINTKPPTHCLRYQCQQTPQRPSLPR